GQTCRRCSVGDNRVVIDIRRDDVRQLSAEELRPAYELERARSEETWPEDGFVDFDSWLIRTRRQPAHSVSWVLTATSDGQPVGQARVHWEDQPENRHLAGIGLFVEPGWRRRGLGRRLLAEASAVAEEGGRTLLMG